MVAVIKSAAKRAPTAIAMMNMGGPSTLPEVQDFLTNLFTDPEIIPMGKVQPFVGPWVAKNRTPKITDQYAAIGGGSPIRKWTNIQGEEMCKILDEIRPETAPHKHYVFFRYANPLTEESLKQMKADGVTRAIAFSQYPQWSCTTTGSSMNQLWRELDRLDMTDDFQWSLIDRWNTHPGYISAVANRVRQGLEQFAPEDRDKVVIMFSAHSVPMKVVYKGDPYTKEIASTVERVMEKLGVGNSHILAWQSKVGYLPWMGPSTSNVIKGLGTQGRKHVLTVPIAFTSDHIETLFEIDIEYAEEAQEAGIEQFKRCPSLNDEPLLFSAMADIVKTHLDTNTLHSPQYPLNCPESLRVLTGTGKKQEADTAVALAHTHRSGARQVAMLSSRERLQERQGQHAPPRHEYLQQLVDEYQRSVHVLRKEEIVANLANFAYDPINYASLAQLQIMDLFLDILDADHEETRRVQEKEQEQEQDGKRKRTEEPLTRKHHQLLAEFAIGGVCNCIADPVLQHAFIAGDGFPLVEPYIWSVDDISEAMAGKRHASWLNTVLSALSIAYFLLDSSAFAVVSHEQLRNHIQSLELHANTQIANTAAAFRTRCEEILLYSTPVAMPIAPPLPPPLPPGPPPPFSPPRI